jgi:hypothetical protein
MSVSVSKTPVLVTALVFALVSFAATTAAAQEAEGTAEIEIIANLEIEEIELIQFGTIGKPTAGTQTFTLDPATGNVDDTDDDGFAVDGTSSAGLYAVTGNNGESVTVLADIDDDFDLNGVSLTGLDIEGAGDEFTFALDGAGEGEINVGGTVTVDSTADEGTSTANVTLTASYE